MMATRNMSWAILILAGMLGLLGAFTPVYRSYLAIPIGKAISRAFLAFLLAAGIAVKRTVDLEEVLKRGRDEEVAWALAAILGSATMVLAGLAILFKIGGLVLDDRPSPERTPGRAGFRAAMGLGNLTMATLVALGASLGYGVNFILILALALSGILLVPLMQTLGETERTPGPSAEPRPDLSQERDRVLRMLESGTINADESAELLNALRDPAPAPRPVPSLFTSTRKLALLGALLVLVGFFLPWFSINPWAELQALRLPGMHTMGPPMPMPFNGPGASFDPTTTQRIPMVPNTMANMTVDVAGGDIKHGLGWIVLTLALGAAICPFVAGGLSPRQQRTAESLMLAAGAIILLYLLSGGLRHVSAGLAIVAAGYAMEIIAAVKDMATERSGGVAGAPRTV